MTTSPSWSSRRSVDAAVLSVAQLGRGLSASFLCCSSRAFRTANVAVAAHEDDEEADHGEHDAARRREALEPEADRRDDEGRHDERDAQRVEQGLVHAGAILALGPREVPQPSDRVGGAALADDRDLDPARELDLLLDRGRDLVGDQRGLLVVDLARVDDHPDLATRAHREDPLDPGWRPAISSSSRSRVTYCSSESPRAPGRAPESASAACTITASTVLGSTSLWWASIAWATASGSPWRRGDPRRRRSRACPRPRGVTALPMSCSSAARRAVSTEAPSSPAIDRGDAGALDEVVEDVLAVARAEAQLAEQLDQLRVQPVHVRLERRALALLDDLALDLRATLLVRLLDQRRGDPPVGDQALEGDPRDLAAHAVEAREEHRRGRLVDDHVDAR